VARGLELRRKDMPRLIRELQLRMIRVLLDHRDEEEIRREGVASCLALVREARRQVLSGELGMGQLLMARSLRKPLEAYSSLAPHVVAALQLRLRGLEVREGQEVSFILAGSRQEVRLLRAAPYELMAGRAYDRERYEELLLSAAHTILSPFLTKERLRELVRRA